MQRRACVGRLAASLGSNATMGQGRAEVFTIGKQRRSYHRGREFELGEASVIVDGEKSGAGHVGEFVRRYDVIETAISRIDAGERFRQVAARDYGRTGGFGRQASSFRLATSPGTLHPGLRQRASPLATLRRCFPAVAGAVPGVGGQPSGKSRKFRFQNKLISMDATVMAPTSSA